MQTTELVAGRELDALVAEKVFVYVAWTVPRHSGAHAGDVVWLMQPRDAILAPPPDLPCYSADMAAAWQIVEHMRGQGLRPVLMPDWGKQWQCVVYRQDQYVCQSEWFDSAPLAICRAALAAVDH